MFFNACTDEKAVIILCIFSFIISLSSLTVHVSDEFPLVDKSRQKSLELVDKQLLESVEDNSDDDDDDEEDDGEDDDSEEYLYDDEEDDDEEDDGDMEDSSEEKAKSDKVMSPKMECSAEEYKRLKNNLLLYHCARIGDSDCTEEFTRKGGFSYSCFNLKGGCSPLSLSIPNFSFLFSPLV